MQQVPMTGMLQQRKDRLDQLRSSPLLMAALLNLTKTNYVADVVHDQERLVTMTKAVCMALLDDDIMVYARFAKLAEFKYALVTIAKSMNSAIILYNTQTNWMERRKKSGETVVHEVLHILLRHIVHQSSDDPKRIIEHEERVVHRLAWPVTVGLEEWASVQRA